MAKRRATSDSEEEESADEVPASKRARTNDSSDGEEDMLPAKREGKHKRPKEEDGEVNEEEEDNRFEQENADKIRAAIESKRKVQGGIAEHGIIESIEMHQFMCHKYLTFSFGPQINFIIGHNGSGKSAVLSAITVVLGGKANSTGRGNGLKSFIREGQSVAEVTISIKNQGEEAFKPKEYGKSIIITRRFTKEGSSSWKIRSKDGRVISTKKDELSAICDHMNIQVDNPMNVLTQDAARQFLSASHLQTSTRYAVLPQGHALSQLSEEYDTCLDNITQTTKILTQKREAIPDLRTAFTDATIRFEEAAKAREQKKKVDDLKKELAWSHVQRKEEEMTEKIEEAAKITRRLPKLEENVKIAKVCIYHSALIVRQFLLEAELQGLGDIQDLNVEKVDLQGKIRANKGKLGELIVSLLLFWSTAIASTNKQIEGYDRQIAEEARRMAAHTQAKHDETQRKLEQARNSVQDAESALKNITEQKAEIAARVQELNKQGETAIAEQERLKKLIQENEQMIKNCVQHEQNALLPYGRDIKGVLDKISRARWAGDMPLGPLGVHIKARDPNRWGELLRSQLGQFLTAFAVTDAADRKQLKQLLESTGNHHVLIIIYEKDMFDYQSGEPPEHVLTVLRALDISDPWVLRIMINVARIERQILAPTRIEGEQMMRALQTGGSAWTGDMFSVRVFPEGGSSSTPLNVHKKSDIMSLLLTGRDAASEINHYRGLIEGLNVEYMAAKEKQEGIKAQWTQARRQLDGLNAQDRATQDVLRRAKIALSNLQQEANDDLPAGMAGFEAAKAEAEAEKQSLVEQFTDVTRQKAELDEAQVGLLQQQNKLRDRISAFDARRGAVTAKIEAAVTERMEAQNKQNHYETKLRDDTAKAEQAEAVATLAQTEFGDWTEKALQYSSVRVENPRKTEVIQRNLESVKSALKERERRQGATVEEMTIEVNKAKAKLDAAERDIREMSNLNKALKASLVVRLARWQEFRRHIALRCKLVFGFNLSHRGYFGKVLFNHDAGTLQLKVQTDEQVATQGGRDKDPRSLSGGEKSFSTICLLLALWESIGCPLRCLDEFDVFMDAVNRRISMKMMIDTANSSDKKQYILITPQDMGNVQVGPTVRVNRMTDPERGQGVLEFGA
ncbi:hypothetical protein BD779DRAFT_1434318 [Infundibulicybe gibba]|nr:hypothetical protein BD779DRAFT_1434318 [Infundibulicybe gibba]